MKISSGTIARTVVLVLALVNQVLSVLGYKIIPIEDGQVNDFITMWNCQESCSLKNTQNSLSIIVQFADCNRCNCSSHIFGILSSSP